VRKIQTIRNNRYIEEVKKMEKFIEIKSFIFKHLITIISVTISIISIVGSIVYVYTNKCEVCTECITLENNTEVSSVDELDETIKVDVKGAVAHPGVYELNTTSNVNDAIVKAGGITKNGITTNINLSKKLTDEMVVYVFTKKELDAKTTANEVVCEVPKCECEEVVVNKEICSNASITTTTSTNSISSTTDTNHSSNNTQNSQDTLVSINTDSIEELMTLDGIGESKAKAIIEYRTQNGNFKAIEEIMNVSGIGEKAFEKIKDNIKI